MRRSRDTPGKAGNCTSRAQPLPSAPFLRFQAVHNSFLQKDLADGEGFDSISVTTSQASDLRQSRQSPNSSGTESGTVGDETGTFPPDLRVVVIAWPRLTEADRKAVLAIVREAVASGGR
jgi:hypothetical protein